MADEYVTPATAGEQRLPRVTIEFCTQCKWLLRAAYYAQELLSTFSTSLGEVALQPSTGGTFIITIHHSSSSSSSGGGGGGGGGTAEEEASGSEAKTLWDRKVDGGFPETKELKRRVRDVIEPKRDLGHVDREYPKTAAPTVEKKTEETKTEEETKKGNDGKECEDCK